MASGYEAWSDRDLRDELRVIDQDDSVHMTTFEAKFIESVCYARKSHPLTAKQREIAIAIIVEYS